MDRPIFTICYVWDASKQNKTFTFLKSQLEVWLGVCTFFGKTKEFFVKMSKVHKIAVKALTFDDLFNDQCVGGIGNRIVTCEECDKEFGNVGIFEMHLQEVHSLDALDHCEKCTNQFKRRMGLIGHLRQVHLAPLVEDDTYKRPLGCDLCDAFLVINGFTSYDELDSHTKIIHGPVSSLKN